MRFKSLLFLALSLSSLSFGQTKSVLKNTTGNTITESLTFGSGKTLTIASGATLNATGATLIGITGSGGTWGSITGSLADQTDLSTALGLKVNASTLATVATSGAYADLSGLPGLQDIIGVNARGDGVTADIEGTPIPVFANDDGTHFFNSSGYANNAVSANQANYATMGYGFNAFFHPNGNTSYISLNEDGSASFANSGFTINTSGQVIAGIWLGTPLALNKIAQGGATSGQVMSWNGSVWAPATPASVTWGNIGGTLSSQTDLNTALGAKESALTFNGGLSRSTNTVSIATGGVTNAMLAGSIAASKITGTAITAADTGTVTNAMLAGSIATNKITGLATSATTDTTNAANISSGTLPAARMPALTGAITTTAGTVATSLSATTVTAGSYGSATAVPTFTVGADGRLTAAANVTITGLAASSITGTAITAADTGTVTNTMLAGSIATSKITGLATSATTDTTNAANISSGTLLAARMPALTGDITSTAGAVATILATVNANVGSFGSATATPTFTVNAKGLLTAAGSVTITPAIGSVTGLGTGIATALGINVGTAGAPVINGGALGTPSSGTVTNLTGTASININGTVGATTPTTGVFTTLGVGTTPASASIFHIKAATGGTIAYLENLVGQYSQFITRENGINIGFFGYISGTYSDTARRNGFEFGTIGSNAFISFRPADTERARFTNSGNFLIGTTTDSSNGLIQVAGGASFTGNIVLSKTITATGTTGAQTINKSSGSVNFAAAATSLVVTNSLVTTSSVIICTVGTNDTTMKSVSVVAGPGSFTIYANAAATAETRVNFLITN